MSSPSHPAQLETVLLEPDRQRVVAVLPGTLWLAPGDVVELEDPPRDARVLSTRLQLRGGAGRILVVLDIPDDSDTALRRELPTEVVLTGDVDEDALGTGDELDQELRALEAPVEDGPRSV